jgi:predicted cation transporter
MDITEYIDSELFIIIPVLYVIGIAVKKSDINDKWIPLILGGMGVALATVYKIALYTPDSVSEVIKILYVGFTQGILCAAGSVYANNIIKQMKGKKNGNDGGEGVDEDNNALR